MPYFSRLFVYIYNNYSMYQCSTACELGRNTTRLCEMAADEWYSCKCQCHQLWCWFYGPCWPLNIQYSFFRLILCVQNIRVLMQRAYFNRGIWTSIYFYWVTCFWKTPLILKIKRISFEYFYNSTPWSDGKIAIHLDWEY